MDYSDKLLDPKWQRLRLKVMSRDKFKCRICKSGTKSLSIHHLFYFGSNPWDTPMKWLITVCQKDCHKNLEDKKGKPLELTDNDYKRMYRKFNRERNRNKS